jgi:hypothetical protein
VPSSMWVQGSGGVVFSERLTAQPFPPPAWPAAGAALSAAVRMLLHFASAALKLGPAVSSGLRVELRLAPGSGMSRPFWRMQPVNCANTARTRVCAPATAPPGGLGALGVAARGVEAPAGGVLAGGLVAAAAGGGAEASGEVA